MSKKKFIQNVTEALGLDDFQASSKKKSIKILLKKLNSKKEVLEKKLEAKLEKKVKKELAEERDIIICHIEKGEKILKKLNS
jgi:hypothetical protein